MSFYYNHNLYSQMYEFDKPDPNIWGNEALEQYEVCKGYVRNNHAYDTARSDTGLGRQVRTHTCFDFCALGEDENFLGDDREQCVDL